MLKVNQSTLKRFRELLFWNSLANRLLPRLSGLLRNGTAVSASSWNLVAILLHVRSHSSLKLEVRWCDRGNQDLNLTEYILEMLIGSHGFLWLDNEVLGQVLK